MAKQIIDQPLDSGNANTNSVDKNNNKPTRNNKVVKPIDALKNSRNIEAIQTTANYNNAKKEFAKASHGMIHKKYADAQSAIEDGKAYREAYQNFQESRLKYNKDKDEEEYLKAGGDSIDINYNTKRLDEISKEEKELRSRVSDLSNKLNDINGTLSNEEQIELANINKQLSEMNSEEEKLQKELSVAKNHLENVAYDKAVQEGNQEEADYYADIIRARDYNFGETVGMAIGKSIANIAQDATVLAHVLKDNALENAANNLDKTYKESLEKGEISQETFDRATEMTKQWRDYDAMKRPFVQSIREDQKKLDAMLNSAYSHDGVVERFIEQGISSSADFLVKYGLFKGGTTAVFGLQSYTERYAELSEAVDENGNPLYTKEQIEKNAVWTGLASYLTEKIGMDSFAKILTGGASKYIYGHAFDYLFKSLVQQGLAEGSEEIIEALADGIIDSITLGTPIEYNAGDIFYSFVLGAFSGVLMGAGASVSFTVSTTQQYNTLKNDIDTLKGLRKKATSQEEIQKIDNAIFVGENALNNFEEKSKLGLAVNMQNDNINQNSTTQEVEAEMAEAITPNVEEAFETANQIENVVSNITNVSKQLLLQKGINMDVNQYVELSQEEKNDVNKLSENFNKAIKHINLGFDTSVDVNGYIISSKNGKPTIIVNPKSPTLGGTLTTVSAVHELVHSIENTDEYKKIVSSLDQDKLKAKTNELSKGLYRGADNPQSEAVAKELSENIIDSNEFIEHLAKYNTSFAYRVLYKLRGAVEILGDSDQSERIIRELTKALSKQTNIYTGNDIKYSKTDNQGRELTEQQEDYFKNSKARNENGELLVLYHGSPDLAHTIFDPSYRFETRNGIFLTTDVDVASSYSGISNSQEDGRLFNKYKPPKLENAKQVNDYLTQIGYHTDEEGSYDYYVTQDSKGHYHIFEGDEDGTQDVTNYYYSGPITSGEEAVEIIFDMLAVKFRGNYEMYANITNPLIIDGEGHNWNDLPKGILSEKGKTFTSLKTKEDIENLLRYFGVDGLYDVRLTELERDFPALYKKDGSFAGRIGNTNDNESENLYYIIDELYAHDVITKEQKENALKDLYEDLFDGYERGIETNEWVDYAKENGYDGVILKNITDSGDGYRGLVPSDVVVVMDSNQIKSTDNKNPTSNPDVRYSKIDRSKYKNWDETRQPISLEQTRTYDVEGKTIDELVEMAQRIRQYLVAPEIEALRNREEYTDKNLSRETREALSILDEIAKAIPKTTNDVSPENMKYREELLNSEFEKHFKDTPKEKKAFIILGPSAGGKSTYIRNEIDSKERGVVDSDEFKFNHRLFKQYGGIMSDALHDESDKLATKMRERAIEEGYNILLPLVGRNTDKLNGIVDALEAKGYDVTVSAITIPSDKARYRAINRFVTDDRYLRSDYLNRIDNKPTLTYYNLIERGDVNDGGLWNTDVGFGEKPKRINELRLETNSGTMDEGEQDSRRVGSTRDGQRGNLGNDDSNVSSKQNLTNGNAQNSAFLNEETNEQENPEEYPVGFSRAVGQNIEAEYQRNIDKYGAFEPGEEPRQDIKVPKATDYGKTSQFARNYAEAPNLTNEESILDFAESINNGLFSYVESTNKEKVDDANKKLDRIGIEKMYEEVMNNSNITPRLIAEESVVLRKLSAKNDSRATQLAIKMANDATVAGQTLQAFQILKRLTPEGQLSAAYQSMQRMQAKLDAKYGNKAPTLQISDDLAEKLRTAKTNEEIDRARKDIADSLAEQVPSSFSDQIRAWRYLSMLGNPTTHIRNFLGNALFAPLINVKNSIGAVLEDVTDKALKATKKQGLEYKTKSILNPFSQKYKDLYKAGEEEYDFVKGSIEKNHKYEQQSFSKKTWLGRALNKVSNINSLALDKEDFIFSKARFADSYAQYLNANGLDPKTISADMQHRANAYAMREAQKATYRDFNSVADWLNKLEYSTQKGLRMASFVKDAVVPFTRTPMNIVKRGMEYSPIGLAKTILYDSSQLYQNKITVNDYIDNLSSGLTGTGIVLIGALLKGLGIFRTKDDDSSRKQNFDKDNGEQDYSIDLSPLGLNGTYTIDWMAPEIMPLAMGAELYDVFSGLQNSNGKNVIDAVADVSARLMDPVMETTMLSSLKQTLSSYANSGGEWFGDMVGSVVSSYISQFFPTVGGKIARAIDETRRTTYPNSGLIDKTIKTIANKIPFASMTNQPYINTSGQETKNTGGNFFGRLAFNLLSPGNYSNKELDKYDEEIYRLYNSTGDINAFPSNKSNSTTYDKEKYDLSESDYTKFNKTRLSLEDKYVKEFIDSASYEDYTDEEKVETLKDIRKYALDAAKEQYLKGEGVNYNDKWYTKANEAINNKKIDVVDYFDYLNREGTNQAETVKYLESTDLTKKQKEYLYSQNNWKTSYEDAYSKVFGKK